VRVYQKEAVCQVVRTRRLVGTVYVMAILDIVLVGNKSMLVIRWSFILLFAVELVFWGVWRWRRRYGKR